jgi:hypothetical protein
MIPAHRDPVLIGADVRCTWVAIVAGKCICFHTNTVCARVFPIARIIIALGAVGHGDLDARIFVLVAFFDRTRIARVTAARQRPGSRIHAQAGAAANSRHPAEAELHLGTGLSHISGCIRAGIILLVARFDQAELRTGAGGVAGGTDAVQASLCAVAIDIVTA